MKKEYKRWRMLTRKQWREHRSKHFPAAKGWSEKDRDNATDIAATNSNYMHNPVTGHHEFALKTPAWIVRMAKRQKWISTQGKMEWK